MRATVAVVGPGGVGGFVAGALARAGNDVTVVAREPTAQVIAEEGLQVDSVRLGSFTAHPRAATALDAAVDVAILAVKAPALEQALDRVHVDPGLVVPLLNGVEHLATLRRRFGDRAVAGSIRIAAERVEPGHVVHTSPAFRIELGPEDRRTTTLAHVLRAAEIPTKVLAREADVLWTKLARLCPLALGTAASALPIGAVFDHPRWRVLLARAVGEVAAVARASGVPIEDAKILDELAQLDPGQSSSLARDVAAGHAGELDAIAGGVIRAGAAAGVECPAIAELARAVEQRVR